ncbi:MAG: hypothetical protein KC505_01985 [Myxococcales bacterium]|nr:hypothetical protein [Myxococcales bacterium]USN51226.1 MAG: hypothetical protein H6731_02110 [Myxococcales bacterium]
MSDANKSELSSNVVEFPLSKERVKKGQETSACVLNRKKRALFAEWLEHGTVMVLFDARASEVKVPTEFSVQGSLRLNFCYDFHVPDFSFNEYGVWATLSFDSGEHFCMVPWASVYGIQSTTLKSDAIWFEHFPADLQPELVLGMTKEEFQTLCKQEHCEEEDCDESNNVISIDFGQK